ncbi:hypothetical protein DL96DRAFT_1818521 [Flagelloscypha sp. PMI_526]|nr:hypothetical protein DL96DRAFT_1818521 [Flagelloscypha sp. PMI_526]
MIIHSLLAKKHTAPSMPLGKSIAQTHYTVSLPAELWIRIASLLDSKQLWQLRNLCSALREHALDMKFQDLDLSFVSDLRRNAPCNDWKTRLDYLEVRLNWIEQAYIARRVTSLAITPHLEYAHQINPRERPSLKKESSRVPQVTARLMRLCKNIIRLESLTLYSPHVTHFGESTKYGKIPPKDECPYIAHLLVTSSSHLRHLHLNLSTAAPDWRHTVGLRFDRSTLEFPLLETFELHFRQPLLLCVPDLYQLLGRSPQLHTVKLEHYGLSGPWSMAVIPTPICLNGGSLSTVRTLYICGGSWKIDFELRYDILPILPQIENLTLYNMGESATSCVQHLNPKKLRRLMLSFLVSEAVYPAMIKTFHGTESALKELELYTSPFDLRWFLKNFPVFPHLSKLFLCGKSWDTGFLIRLPASAPGLETLTLWATESIVVRNGSRLQVPRLPQDQSVDERLVQDIDGMACTLWANWGLEAIHLWIDVNEMIGGTSNRRSFIPTSMSDGTTNISTVSKHPIRVLAIEFSQVISLKRVVYGLQYRRDDDNDDDELDEGSPTMALFYRSPLLPILERRTSCVTSVAFSPNGERIASRSYDKSVRTWNVQLGEQLLELSGHKGRVRFVAFYPSGMQVASGSDGETVRIWDTKSDSKLGVSGSHNNTVRIWDANIDEHLSQLDNHNLNVKYIVFSPDRKQVVSGFDDTRLVSGSFDEIMRTWNATSLQQLQPDTVDFLPSLGPHLQSAVSSCYFREDGWAVTTRNSTGTECLLFWLPPSLRPVHPRALRVITKAGFYRIDLPGCIFGDGWYRIFKA